MFQVFAAESWKAFMEVAFQQHAIWTRGHPLRSIEWVVPHRLFGTKCEQYWCVQRGHWAQMEVLLPQEWVQKRVRAALKQGEGASLLPLGLSQLSEFLFEVIHKQASHPALATFQAYLFPQRERGLWQVDEGHAMRLALSLSELFWKYLHHRPEMLAHWELAHLEISARSETFRMELWQPWLWQQLRSHQGFRRFWNGASEMERVEQIYRRSPPPYFTFWFQMGPLHERAWRWLQLQEEVVFFASIPDWFSQNGRSFEMALTEEPPVPPSLRGFLQEPQGLLEQLLSEGPKIQSLPLSPASSSKQALQRFQQACRGQSLEGEGWEGDESFQIHPATSILAEVEGAAEYFGQQFLRDRTLQPRECLLVVPRLKDYLPYLRARAEGQQGHLFPLQLPPMHWGKIAPGLEGLLNGLTLLQQGDESEAWKACLTHPSFLKKFGLAVADVQAVLQAFAWARRDWTPVKPAWSSALGVPQAPILQAWSSFLMEQLRQAFALQSPGLPSIPRWGMRKDELELLSKLWQALLIFQAYAHRFASPAPPREWKLRSLEWAKQLLDAEGYAEVVAGLERIFPSQISEVEGSSLSWGLGAWRDFLTQRWKPTVGSFSPCMHNQIVCVEPLQARGLQFRHGVILGINEGIYPSAPEHLSFDLMGRYPQLQDEIPLHQQRTSLWQLCLAAQEGLVLSFRRGEDERGFQHEPASCFVEWLRALSPSLLQAIHEAEAWDWQSCSPPASPNLSTVAKGEVPAKLSEEAERGELAPIFLSDLKRGFENPFSAWRRKRGIWPQSSKVWLPISHQQREALLGRRRRQFMKQSFSENVTLFFEPELLKRTLELEGLLPADGWGERKFLEELRAFKALHEVLNLSLWEGPWRLGQHFSASGRWMVGSVRDRAPEADLRIDFLPASWSMRRAYGLWLEHLLLCATGRPAPTLGLNLTGGWELLPLAIEEAQWALDDLIQLHQLSQSGRPLPLFLESSWAWLQAFLQENLELQSKLVSPIPLQSVWEEEARRWESPSSALKAQWERCWPAFEKSWFGGPFIAGERTLFGRVGDHCLSQLPRSTLNWLAVRMFLAFQRFAKPVTLIDLRLRRSEAEEEAHESE